MTIMFPEVYGWIGVCACICGGFLLLNLMGALSLYLWDRLLERFLSRKRLRDEFVEFMLERKKKGGGYS